MVWRMRESQVPMCVEEIKEGRKERTKRKKIGIFFICFICNRTRMPICSCVFFILCPLALLHTFSHASRVPNMQVFHLSFHLLPFRLSLLTYSLSFMHHACLHMQNHPCKKNCFRHFSVPVSTHSIHQLLVLDADAHRY